MGGGGDAFMLFPLPSSPLDQRPINVLEIKYSDVCSIHVIQKSRYKRSVTKRLRIFIPEYAP